MEFIKGGVVSLCVVFATPVLAQEAESETAAETEAPTETAPGFTPGFGQPNVQTSPAEGTFRAGEGLSAPEFILGRRLRLSGSLGGGYDDNVNTTPGGSPSWFSNINALFTYLFGTPRYAIDLVAGLGVTYYFESPGGRDYDPNVFVRLALAYKMSERLALSLSGYAAYQAEPDVTTELSANRRLGNFFRLRANVSAHYQWTPRISSVTGLEFSTVEFEQTTASSLSRSQISLNEELLYLLFPTTTVTGGYRIGVTDYQNGGSSPISQSVTTGVDQTFGPHVTAFFRGGIQFRSSQTSPYLDLTLHYSLEPGVTTTTANAQQNTYIVWTNRYSIEESDVSAGSGRETYRTNLIFNWRITERISANFSASYVHGTGAGNRTGGMNAVFGNGAEELFDIGPAVRYAFTPSLVVTAGYHYTDFSQGSGSTSGIEPFGYTRNRYFATLTYTF